MKIDSAFSPDGTRLVTTPAEASSTQTLEVWDTQRAARTARIELGQLELGTAAPKFSPDERLIAVADGGRCVVFEVETGARVHELRGCVQPLFSTDGAT